MKSLNWKSETNWWKRKQRIVAVLFIPVIKIVSPKNKHFHCQALHHSQVVVPFFLRKKEAAKNLLK